MWSHGNAAVTIPMQCGGGVCARARTNKPRATTRGVRSAQRLDQQRAVEAQQRRRRSRNVRCASADCVRQARCQGMRSRPRQHGEQRRDREIRRRRRPGWGDGEQVCMPAVAVASVVARHVPTGRRGVALIVSMSVRGGIVIRGRLVVAAGNCQGVDAPPTPDQAENLSTLAAAQRHAHCQESGNHPAGHWAESHHHSGEYTGA